MSRSGENATIGEANYLFEGGDWSFATLDRTHDAIEDIALNDLGLNVYRNQIEVISFDQMLDANSSHGMPLMYPHWSFGKRIAKDAHFYRKGYTGLAYEIVINSNPCISYVMEENTMALQALVMAHAAFGHNHFFKNNYLFRQWTDADGILDYLEFAKRYIGSCEERHGRDAVEQVLDSAHALMDHGVFRYRRPPKLNPRVVEERAAARRAHEERNFNDLWRTVPGSLTPEEADKSETAFADRRAEMKLPQENLLYFLEKHSPVLEGWQREVLRIVRHVAQYFYPQRQTKVMNEGCATFVHYYIMNKLYDRGLIGEGTMLEVMHNHSNVIFQPDFDDPRFSGLNPYALGLAMMEDIKRICVAPEAEDRQWFPEFAGNEDWRAVLRDAWANYRDESFILQYLSPRLIRKLRLFTLFDDAAAKNYKISDIHDEEGYRRVRSALARDHDPAVLDPNIQVVDADLQGARVLQLRHVMINGVPIGERQAKQVLALTKRLWGYEVRLDCVDEIDGKPVTSFNTAATVPDPPPSDDETDTP